MAAASPLQKLQENATCSICLSFFKDPMMIMGCGHNFCKACITSLWNGSHRNVSCPQCWVNFSRAKLKPNRQLKDVVDAARELISQSLTELTSLGNICSSHKKPLDRFCQDDNALICEMCVGGKEHGGHVVKPAGEAVKEQKNRIQNRIEELKKERDAAANCLRITECTQRYLTESVREERKMFIKEIEKFCQSLKGQEQLLLPHLDELETSIKKKQSESKTTRKITQLNGLILTAEKLCELSGAEFLTKITKLNDLMNDVKKTCSQLRTEYGQEIRSTFNLLGEEQFLENTLGDLENRVQKIAELNITVKASLQKCKDKVITELWHARKDALKPYNAENVVLDCDTAHNLLTISENQDSAFFDMEEWEDKPYHPRRFDKRCCVLGTRGFNSGRFFWEVDVKDGKEWDIGVVRESVERKGPLYFAPEHGIWAIGSYKGYHACTSSGSTPLNLSEPLKTIEVYLDYEAGEVSFFNQDSKSIIFTFPPVKFGGEKIYPWFSIEDGQIRIGEVENESFEHYCLSTGIIKPWELHEYELPLDPRKHRTSE